MPSWFEDHLACAPLGAWLPSLLEGATWLEHGSGTPRRLGRMLAVAARPSPGVAVRGTLVHTAALHVAPGLVESTAEVDVVIDLAWVSGAAQWWRLRPWRRAPVRRDVADRLAWIVGLGLVAPQQWTCTDPLAVVVTLAHRR